MSSQSTRQLQKSQTVSPVSNISYERTWSASNTSSELITLLGLIGIGLSYAGALAAVIKAAKSGAKILDLCSKGDSVIEE